ncbi:MAG TPA: hypothetical protein PLD59_06490 [Tepidisphaeraceae bacterium]|nr:hypothetical protein [Tepidisphaeraceae bacterium]
MAKVKHKSVKSSEEETAYDPPDTSNRQRWAFVGRGPKAIFAKPTGVVRLDDDVAAVFKDSGSVNKALRLLIEAVPNSVKRRKSA